jgi:hypothetical protein
VEWMPRSGPRAGIGSSLRARDGDTPRVDWQERFEHEAARYEDGAARLGGGSDQRQRQLTRMGNAAWGAGLCLLMQREDAAEWLSRAAARWRESYAQAPPDSWGRPVGAIKALILAGDWPGAEEAARWALDEGAAGAESSIGRYAAALAHLVLGHAAEARIEADAIRIREDFPHDVGDSLAMLAAEDVVGYIESVESVLESFETRGAYLEDVPVADTVLVLQALAGRLEMAAELEPSPLLPPV